MKYALLFISTLSSLFLVNCSSIPEITPYEKSGKELTVEDVTNHDNDFEVDSLFKEDSQASSSSDDSSTPSDDEEIAAVQPPQKDPEVLPEFEPAMAPEKVEKPKALSRKVASNFKNGLHVFSQNCAMKSKPSTDSDDAGEVQAGKKLWLDKHNNEWLKAYKKTGTVYVPVDCVK